MEECTYQHQCEAYRFLVDHNRNPRCRDLLEICELESPSEIAEACDLYKEFANPLESKPINRKPYITKND